MSQVAPALVGRYLEELARSKRTTTYGELAERFGLPGMDGAWLSHPLSLMFDYLDKEDSSASRPFRTALVIRQDANMPGDGFFESLAKHRPGRIPAKSIKEREKARVQELKAVFSYRWPKA